ncbi:transketolase, partial [Thermococcus sibiricus]|uniref:Transketolase, N-terminal section n=1 Tax=Thermococcus sibiricus (strain DSM 12597 / MM 739) TaxID=604354 RepID=C6A4W0_THESM
MSESLVQLVLSNKLKEMLSEVNNFHLNSSITCLEILKAVIAKKGENDVIILSKGHSAPAFYVILSELGLLSEEELKSFTKMAKLSKLIQLSITTYPEGQGFQKKDVRVN